MRTRIALGAAVLAVGAGGAALALRANGYLGGRDPDGPLEGGVGGARGTPRDRAGAVGWNDLVFSNSSDDPVELESVEIAPRSPGLGFLGAWAWDPEETDIPLDEFDTDAFPPPVADPERLREIPDTTVPPGDALLAVGLGLRLPGPGRWYADGVRVRYRQGARRFDELFRGPKALCVGLRLRVHCLPPDAPQPDDGLVIYGGAQDFGPRARNEEGGLYDENEVVLYFREHHPVVVTVTLLNAGDEDIEVRGLRFFPPPVGRKPEIVAVSEGADVQVDRDRYAPQGPLEPLHPFTVPAGEGRLVRLRGRFTSCDQVEPGTGLGSPMVALTADGEDEVEGLKFVFQVPTGACRRPRR